LVRFWVVYFVPSDTLETRSKTPSDPIVSRR
jgi:hypothetical protein